MVRGIVVALLCAGCAADPAGQRGQAITNGTLDPDDPAVVAIVSPAGDTVCSGSLIDRHTVLTAAHCLNAPGGIQTHRVLLGASLAAGGYADITRARAHPLFDPTSLADDIGLLTIRQAATATPLPLDPRTLDGSLVGQSFRVVGFGVSAANAVDSGQRRTGNALVTAVDAVEFTSAATPAQPCVDDSGGPALFGPGATITGVISHGDAACVADAVYARVDVAAPFIQAYLTETATGSAQVGDRCFHDDQCAGGPCLVTADEPRESFCSRSCQKRSDCPAAMICAVDGCRYPSPSPGALGAVCAQPGDCVDGACFIATGATQGVCTRRCVAIGQQCPSGFACQNLRGVEFDCLRKASAPGGCTVAPDRRESAHGGLAALLLMGLVLATRKQRARDQLRA